MDNTNFRDNVTCPSPEYSISEKVQAEKEQAEKEQTEKEQALSNKATYYINQILNLIIILSIIVLTFSLFYAQGCIVSGSSMDDTYQDGQKIFVSRTAYWQELPERGDVITFKLDNEYLLKRVIALPGDTIRIEDCKTYVNDKQIAEPYVDSWSSYNTSMAEQTVPEGHVFVMGDNRDNSFDSRDFGFVDLDQIVGRVINQVDYDE